ncbi:hypothetical protein BGM19_03500 [Streptomyces agglomeratus]|nr:hypothetical protein BGM19_03500 [Streptomyces agglomeratus]
MQLAAEQCGVLSVLLSNDQELRGVDAAEARTAVVNRRLLIVEPFKRVRHPTRERVGEAPAAGT